MKSLWIETSKDNKDLEPLNENKHTEICVIGAGMFGLTTAYYLSKLNKNVIVLEKGKIGEKVSGNTTGNTNTTTNTNTGGTVVKPSNTTADKNLPKTGSIDVYFAVAATVLVVAGIVAYINYRKNNTNK